MEKLNKSNKNLSIGLDFDNVISDSLEIKLDYLKKDYGRDIPPECCTRSGYLELGYPVEEYNVMIRAVYATDLFMAVPEMPGAGDIIRRLRREGNKTIIITSRHEDETKIAKKWISSKNIEHDGIFNTSDNPKTSLIKKLGIVAYVDDSVEKLDELIRFGINLFLFDPREFHSNSSWYEKIRNWEEFYNKIKVLR